jgi:hypothetical protein
MEKERFEEIRELDPIIHEKKIVSIGNLSIAFLIGVIIVIAFISFIFLLSLDTFKSIILATILIIIYAIILFFLLEPEFFKEITKTTIKTIKEPVVKEVIIEKPVVEQVMHETEKTIYVTNPKKSLNIPKYDYIASSETRTYHKKSCRLGKLIKKKYKLLSNDPNFFLNKGFKPCKVCIRHLKKV